MDESLQERVRALERKVEQLTAELDLVKNSAWQHTFGLSRDDPGFREMVQLGQEYRRNRGRDGLNFGC